MAISFVAVNNSAAEGNGTTTTADPVAVTPTMPTGTAAGDRVWVFQTHNCATGSAATPANWTALFKDTQIGSGAVSAGLGMRWMSAYYRDYDGVWTMPSFALLSVAQNTQEIGAVTIRKGVSEMWVVPTFSGKGEMITPSASFTATTSAFGFVLGGFIFTPIMTSQNSNQTAASVAITAGTGFAITGYAERVDGGFSTGNDVGIKVNTGGPVTNAGSPNPNAVTVSSTMSGATQAGVIVVQQTVSVRTVKEHVTVVVRRAGFY